MRSSAIRSRQEILTLWVLLCGSVFAQSPPAFEAASIRPSAPQSSGGARITGGPGTSDTTQVSWTRISLIAALTRAWNVRAYQISGPAAVLSQLYDIHAVIAPGTNQDQFNLMMQNLLRDRFHLVLHHEAREFQGYELVIDKGGSKLKESSPEDIAFDQSAPGQKLTKDANGVFQLAHPGFIELTHPGSNDSPAISSLICRAQSLSRLLVVLNMNLDRPYVDNTGLTGKYDYRLEFALDRFLPILPAGPSAQTPPADLPDDSAPRLFAALQQQLGLRLDSKKLPFDVIVIDRIDKAPTDN